jgi:beta-aspartyl-peptidase (threonine type)
MPEPVIIAHGGAGKSKYDRWEDFFRGAHSAALAGQRVLSAEGSALEAAIEAVRTMEENSTFNAGYGAELNRDGVVECDALVVTDELQSGAVAGVRGVRNPVLLARIVMEETPHLLITGDGAFQLAEEYGLAGNPSSLVLESRLRRWREIRAEGGGFEFDVAGAAEDAGEPGDFPPADTVGACALDRVGRLAVASSSGGYMMKYPGRVGDTPLLGAGSYCGPAGAVTCTGHGESIIRAGMARYAYGLLAEGADAAQAAAEAVRYLVEEIQGFGGLVVLDARGNRAWLTSTSQFAIGVPEYALGDPSSPLGQPVGVIPAGSAR